MDSPLKKGATIGLQFKKDLFAHGFKTSWKRAKLAFVAEPDRIPQKTIVERQQRRGFNVVLFDKRGMQLAQTLHFRECPGRSIRVPISLNKQVLYAADPIEYLPANMASIEFVYGGLRYDESFTGPSLRYDEVG